MAKKEKPPVEVRANLQDKEVTLILPPEALTLAGQLVQKLNAESKVLAGYNKSEELAADSRNWSAAEHAVRRDVGKPFVQESSGVRESVAALQDLIKPVLRAAEIEAQAAWVDVVINQLIKQSGQKRAGSGEPPRMHEIRAFLNSQQQTQRSLRSA